MLQYLHFFIRRLEKIKDSRKAQVLVVDHDDAISLSGDSDVDTEDEDGDMSGFSPLRGMNSPVTEDQDNNSKILHSGLYLIISPYLLSDCFDNTKKSIFAIIW